MKEMNTRKSLALARSIALLIGVVLLSGYTTKQPEEPETLVPIDQEHKSPTSTTDEDVDNLGTYWSHINLPNLTSQQKLKLAAENKKNGQQFIHSINRQAQTLSNHLENYIKKWLAGNASAELPRGLLPPYIDNEKTKNWTLKNPDKVNPSEQWLIIPAHSIDPEYKKLYMLGTDPHVTYLKLVFVAPIGSKLLIEGDFPHARFMDFEILQPLDPEHPASGQIGGSPEVPIVDVDIEPDAGSVNPFRIGANRNATNRHYHLTFDLETGNAVDLNPEAMQSPQFRAPGNVRTGGPFGFAGAWGDNVFTPSVLWVRIYIPDNGTDVLGGVGLPKATLQLPSGEKFWLQSDFSLAKERQNTRVPAGYEAPKEPYPLMGSQLGWLKIFDLALIRAEENGYAQSKPYGYKPTESTKSGIRQFFSLIFNRGYENPPPGNYESSATICNYISYLTRPFQLGPGKVYVITGKMPTTPKTRDGNPVMEKADARYWSISQYTHGENDAYNTAVNHGSLMDEDIILNENNEYLIVYSLPEDRPKNAIAANGVTWANWGPRSRQTLTIRWMSVMPEWYLPQYAPSEINLPWETAAWSAENYHSSSVGENKPGKMGPYHPVIHYISKEQFEALGHRQLKPQDIPEWRSILRRQ